MSFFKKAPAPTAFQQIRNLIGAGASLGVMLGVAKTVSHNTDRLLGKLPFVESEADFQKKLAEIKAGGKQS